MEISMEVVVRQLTPDLWPELEDLFNTPGPVGRCWCMYWRIGSHYRNKDSDTNKSAFREVVNEGPPPGLLDFDRHLVVGWCQLTPRDELPWLDRNWRLKRLDDVPVWSISCLYVRPKYRRKGVATSQIAEAIDFARRTGAPAVDAYPLDSELTPSASHVGYATTFERVGFTEVGRHVPERPIMRYQFRPDD